MKTRIEVNGHEIEFSRNWFTGSFNYRLDGQRKSLNNILNPLTHFSLKYTQTYAFTFENSATGVGKTKPPILGAICPNKYRFHIDDKFVKEVDSYYNLHVRSTLMTFSNKDD